MVMGLEGPRGSQITTTIVAGTGYAMIHDARALFACVGVLLLLLLRSGIGSRSAAWASRGVVI